MMPSVAWDLSDLYSSADDPRVEADLKALEARAQRFVEEYRGKVDRLRPEAYAAALQEYEAIQRGVRNPAAFAQLLFSANSTLPSHGALLQRVREYEVAIERRLLFFTLETVFLPDDHFAALLQFPPLQRYRHFLKHVRSERPHRLSEAEERVLLEKSLTGRSAFQRLFDETLAAATFHVEVHGGTQELSLSETLARQYAGDRAVRAASAAALSAGLEKRAHLFAFTINTLAHDKAIDDRLTGFPHPEASRHLEDEVDTATVHTMLDACTQHFSTVGRYYRLKREILGLDTLWHYDRYAPLAFDQPEIPWEQARQIVVSAFQRFSPEMGALANRFFEERWIDAEVRVGKRSGAFCMGIAPDWHPYVLLNYLGSQRDVLTLAHELGHGIHDLLASEQPFLEYQPSLAAAETASVFGEMLVFDALLEGAASERERLALLTEQIEGVFATVFRQAAMYRFEQHLHTARRRDGELTVDQINGLWQESLQAMFDGSVQMGEGHRFWWMYVPHFIHSPFYVYAYAFGQLMVTALYARYRQEGASFSPRYLEILRAGGSKRPAELVATAGIDISKREFWEDGLGVIDAMVAKAEETWRRVQSNG